MSSDLGDLTSQWTIAGYIMQTCTSLVSFISSSTIMIMIMSSPAKLSSPYRRIIFGMSSADVIQSLALLIGPFAVPKEAIPELPWAVGNIVSCNIDGFLFVAGATVVPFYLLLLCLYYFCRLNLKMTDNNFSRKIETKAHIFIAPYAITINIWALLLKTFNPLPGYERQPGSACYIVSYPAGCADSPEIYGECTRGKHAMLLAQFSSHGMIVICFIGVVVLMGLLIRHAYWTEKMFQINHRGSNDTNRCCLNFNDFNQRNDESDADYVLRLYRRETVIQAILYFSAFSTVYTAIAVFYAKNVNDWHMPRSVYVIFLNFLYPIMGLFNIIIYTRPKIKKFRMNKPEYSWLRSFLLVVKAGGEVPDEELDEYALDVCLKCWYVKNHHDGVSELSNPTVSPSRRHRWSVSTSRLGLSVASWGRRKRSKRVSKDLNADGEKKMEKKESNNDLNNSTSDDDCDFHHSSQVRWYDEKNEKDIFTDNIEVSVVAQRGLPSSNPLESSLFHKLSLAVTQFYSTDDSKNTPNPNSENNNNENSGQEIQIGNTHETGNGEGNTAIS
mmetsp:Transcript_14567/g.22049  ORF Transcript_14567/g.22049 Transcript_14567/m.22049 type:complete len:556 (-) Transcript_14567:178-1845(-)